jgi:hypothetical protein
LAISRRSSLRHQSTNAETLNNRSVVADPSANSETAVTLVNRPLSLMTWCDDQYAIL